VAIVNVYIDGFNLYYGALKRTPYKWLDLAKLTQELLPSDTIQELHYFTARVSSRAYNLTAAHDQGLYIRALKTLPNLHIKLPAMELVRIEQTDRETNLLCDNPDRLRQVGVVGYKDSHLESPTIGVPQQVGSEVHIGALLFRFIYPDQSHSLPATRSRVLSFDQSIL
jgi:hypothetical protein